MESITKWVREGRERKTEGGRGGPYVCAKNVVNGLSTEGIVN
jgi:hypothetical protein